MRSSKAVLGVTIVFEFYLFPVTFAVTGLAFSAVFSLVSVVDFVATDTRFGGVFVMFVGVAEVAFDLFVMSLERELGFAVVKDLLLTPGLFTVAVGTFFTQFALVAIILFVAVDAVVWRFSVGFSRCVAGIAGGFKVCSVEAKIGHAMVKIERVEAHDIFATAFVVAVTGFTLFGLDVFYSTVKAFFGVDVVLDVFMIMTVKAEGVLTLFLERGVAVFTFLFKFSVIFCQRAGHNQGLKVDR